MKRFLFVYALMVCLFSACSEESSYSGEGERLTLRLSLEPAGKLTEQRSLGDPGETEVFDLPRYLYFYVVNSSQDDANKKYVNSMMLDHAEWTYDASKRIYTLKNVTPSLLLTAKNLDLTNSRVYVIASVAQLHFSEPTTAADVENLSFKLNEQGEDFLLKDVYANSFYDTQNGNLVQGTGALTADVTCYHVAARVDMQWDINPDKQKKYWVESLTLKKLPNEGHFFKPGDNTGVEGNNLTFETQVGNQWYGRHVFYALDHNPVVCDYTLHSADAANNPVVKSLSYETKANKAPYASWYRILQKFGYPEP